MKLQLIYAIAGGVVGLFEIIALGCLFHKAGHHFLLAIVPIYNYIVYLKVAGRPWWWLLLLIIPVVNIVFVIIVCHDIAKTFGRGIGCTLGLIFLGFIWIPVLGFGSARYVGRPAA